MKYDEANMVRDVDFHVSAEVAMPAMVGDARAIGKQLQADGACVLH